MNDPDAPGDLSRAPREALVPLTLLAPGTAAVIVEIAGAGRGIRRRLCAMGLAPGQEVTVCPGRGTGGLIVELHGNRLAIGRGMAHRIMVMSPDRRLTN